jgi:hypothetical protein
MRRSGGNIIKDKTNRCIGYKASVKNEKIEIIKCDKYVIYGDTVCGHHIYFRDMDKKLMTAIKGWYEDKDSVKEDVSFCKRCRHFVEYCDKKIFPNCSSCKEDGKNHRDKKTAAKVKCAWFDRNKEKCRNDDHGGGYCNNHMYVKEYTGDMKDNSIVCSDCHMMKYCNGFSTCHICRKRGFINRIIVSKTAEKKVICRILWCKNPAKDNGFCRNHTRRGWKLDVEGDGTKKVCSKWNRKCSIVLDINGKYVTCDDCRRKNREDTCPYRMYIKSAKNRGIELKLTKEQVIFMSTIVCVYCGEMNEKGFNGIDRIDNNKGYIIGNVLPCCSVCNFMRQTLDINKFVISCVNIINNYFCNEYYWTPTNVYINKKINNSKDKCIGGKRCKSDRRFLLTFNETTEILSNKCYYCRNTNEVENGSKIKMGMDRVDPYGHYEISNTVPCCKTCNNIKWTLTVEDFINKCESIKQMFTGHMSKIDKIINKYKGKINTELIKIEE